MSFLSRPLTSREEPLIFVEDSLSRQYLLRSPSDSHVLASKSRIASGKGTIKSVRYGVLFLAEFGVLAVADICPTIIESSS